MNITTTLAQLGPLLSGLDQVRLTLDLLHDPLKAQADLDPLVDRLEVLAGDTLEGDLQVHVSLHQAHQAAQEAYVLLIQGEAGPVAVALLRVASYRLEAAARAAQRHAQVWAKAS